MSEAYIVAFARSAVVKGKPSGKFAYDPAEDIAGQVLQGLIKKLGPKFDPYLIDDLIVGCSMPENLQGGNIARKLGLRAGLPVQVPAETINRFCASSLQALAHASQAIQAGQADFILAGGLEFQSTTPYASLEAHNNYSLESAGCHLSDWMGLTAERLAEDYGISRQDQDQFAVDSHHKAHKAQVEGKFEDEIVPVQAHTAKAHQSQIVQADDGIRPDTNLDQVSRLKAIFKRGGTVTAASSSQISDGASFLALVSESMLDKLQIQPLAIFKGYQVAGVDPAVMGIGPVPAIQKLLKRQAISLDQIDLIELNEAFAAQALAVIKALHLDKERVNPNGGAIALGHANGATGAVLSCKLLSEMARRSQARYGLVSMCIGGGMGAAALFEHLN
ncbi:MULTISPECIES: thiolase family protein [Aerococcus]|uniref:acetyl-CoA C-acyltransferase n=1 Tax=Aerococcus sanguinicola TaxID=119206 RepID=A0A5N1GL68_9LACT|nr:MULTISPECIES: thiolase family protein [Aerococcus]KAA9301727.1 thiolase family protein [Aerococcus sanguinicola]MDK6368859.1 thiolase family protein [Aerococcus sp. UMB9870]MDK6680197.1 thiolase family protein [Aerococcus sp. UMB8608]MDK6685698.1 thiolase family protein [Aerococcus sp. UMB8623]MDK6939483.1 thiolase family protein [Aerococcus sp. UMB8487]